MQNPVNNGCKPNERYGKSDTARLFGVSRPTIAAYEKRGLKFSLDRNSCYHRYKGIDIIKFYNTQVI
jgi:hypothetical protein